MMTSTTSTPALIAAIIMLSAAIYFGLATGHRYQVDGASRPALAVFKVGNFAGDTWMCGHQMHPDVKIDLLGPFAT
jgi:hypothetical protein